MASIQLISPKNKPAYYKLIANVMVDGKRAHRYSRFEFDPNALKTAAARRCAANAAAVEFERAERTALQRQACTGGRTFQEVALDYIEAERDHTNPLLRLTGDFAYRKNKYNTTYNKELYLRRLSELCELPGMEVSKITKADCEKALQKLSSQGIPRLPPRLRRDSASEQAEQAHALHGPRSSVQNEERHCRACVPRGAHLAGERAEACGALQPAD